MKGSGTFRRKVKKERDLTLAMLLNTKAVVSPIEYSRTPLQEKLRSPSPHNEHESRSLSPVPSSVPSPSDVREAVVTDYTDSEDEYFSPSEDEAEDGECEKPQQSQSQSMFSDFLRDWAIEFNIAQAAMKPLMERLHAEFAINLPMDPRTLMCMYFV